MAAACHRYRVEALKSLVHAETKWEGRGLVTDLCETLSADRSTKSDDALRIRFASAMASLMRCEPALVVSRSALRSKACVK